MAQIIDSLLSYFGVAVLPPDTFGGFVQWFVMICMAVSLFKYVVASIFWLVRSFGKGV